MPAENAHIRNFSIIAHIDHGKSTLADRLLETTGTVTAREAHAQFLDNMELERERGITIKAQTVRMNYTARDGRAYVLNLIDTPGHVDFAYEVSRSLAACEGALLVVDSSQGVEAQTLANVYMALDHNLEVIPVFNKIDLPSADPERTRTEIEDVIGLDASQAVLASAKEGIGIEDVLEAVVRRIPSPQGRTDAPLKALIFDSWYDSYRGVVMLVRVLEGTLSVRQKIMLWSNRKRLEVEGLGVFSPYSTPVSQLMAGEVGVLIANVKEIADAKVGDTVTEEDRPTLEPFPGFKEVKPMVFSGIFPVDAADYENLRDALVKLRLNDSAFTYEAEVSTALGFGFRCGYLGLLHMEIVQERLEREYNLSLITTAPSVVYKVFTVKGEEQLIENPAKLPAAQYIEHLEEPLLTCHIHTPNDYLGGVLKLCQDRRGVQKDIKYLGSTGKRVQVTYNMPLSEVVFDFFDKLKSASRGYASLDYELAGYATADLVKLDILINGDPVDALAIIVHRDRAYQRGRDVCAKLKKVIPKQMYEVAIQASIGSRVIARETISAMRKNVLAKCYGGDISRKRKLLEKQKEGKKRMKQVGSIEIPQEARSGDFRATVGRTTKGQSQAGASRGAFEPLGAGDLLRARSGALHRPHRSTHRQQQMGAADVEGPRAGGAGLVRWAFGVASRHTPAQADPAAAARRPGPLPGARGSASPARLPNRSKNPGKARRTGNRGGHLPDRRQRGAAGTRVEKALRHDGEASVVLASEFDPRSGGGLRQGVGGGSAHPRRDHRTLQDPIRFDDPDPGDRGPDLRQQIHLRGPDPLGQQSALRDQSLATARRCDRLQQPGGRFEGLHQTGDRRRRG